MVALDPVLGLRALADSTRLALARLLLEGAFNVGELQQIFESGQSTISHHLKILVDAELLDVRKEGRLAYYQWKSLLPPSLEALRGFVRQFAPALDAQAKSRVHTVFEQRAERTRSFFNGPSAEALASERSSITGVDVTAPLVAEVPAGASVVDLGTGAGRLLGPLREHSAKVIGIDASARMLDRAGKLARERGWGDVDLRLGTLEHLPLRDGEVDAAVAHLVLHHAAQPAVALGEAFRVLKTAGRLIVADFLPHEQEWMRDEVGDQWLGFDPVVLGQMVRLAGFEDVRVSLHEGQRGELGMFVLSAQRPERALVGGGQDSPRAHSRGGVKKTRSASAKTRSALKAAARGEKQ